MGYCRKLIRRPADYYAAYLFNSILSNKYAMGSFVSMLLQRRTNLTGVFKCEISTGKIQPSASRVTAAASFWACFF